ncbi:MAG TPA: hypothetical protein DCS79_06660 [Gammaproteobacteria bacterium]|jgi:hypothetical protein|nr:hypothetical protein [Gammaproteobacteria bacterium]
MAKQRSQALFLSLLFSLLTLSSCATVTSSTASSTADGIWDFTMSSPFGAVNAVVTLDTSGDTLSGTFDLGNGRLWAIEEGVASTSEVTFRIDRDGSPMVYDMSGTVNGRTIVGVARAMGAEAPWSMTRRD